MKKLDAMISNQRPIWQVVLLHVVTLGFYDFYWFYSNWKQLYLFNRMKVQPWLRTLGLFVPLLNVYLIWNQFKTIKQFCENEQVQSFTKTGGLVAVYIALLVITNHSDKNIIFMMPLSVLPLLFVQDSLNLYWEKVQPSEVQIQAWTWASISLCCVGGLLYLGLFLYSLLSYYGLVSNI